MISDNPANFYTLLDREFFESLDRYQPSAIYRALVEQLLGPGWDVQPRGFWTQCTPDSYEHVPQGWKIHISANAQTAPDAIRCIVPVLARNRVSFKFCSDKLMAQLSTNKNWPRTGAGKFITIYPLDTDSFIRLIEECHQVSGGLEGPYLLTDRRYKDSRVVFYRYGEHLSVPRVNASGYRTPAISSPNGERISDERVPYFRLPAGVEDPFVSAERTPTSSAEGILLNKRYRVTSAERFSAVGGIYHAEDTVTGQRVIIREARPMLVDDDASYDAVEILRKEARILQTLGHTGYVPQFVDLFQEWEHWFLVRELLDAESLWGYAIDFTFGAFKPRSPGEVYERIRDAIRKIATGLQAIHANGVVLRDLTKSNVMFTPDDEVRFIDFELAYELDGRAPHVAGWTQGYASRDQLLNRTPSPLEDRYALGALVLDMLTFTASGLPLNREGVLACLDMVLGDLGLPIVLRDIVTGLLSTDTDARWTLDQVLGALDDVDSSSVSGPAICFGAVLPEYPPARPAVRVELETTLTSVASYIRAKADFSRTDRLWPASPEVFATNPVSIQFGAAGTASFLWRVDRQTPAGVVEWVLRALRTHPCPPGLYTGLSGVALWLLDIGETDRAVKVMNASASRRELIDEAPGLYEGASGWGLANLMFWDRTADSTYLGRAAEAGDHLLRTAGRDANGLFWPVGELVPLGLGHGGSGVSLFLSYLYAAQGEQKYLDAAVQAAEFELFHRRELGQQILWFPHTTARGGAPQSPHMRYGSAGIGSTLIRLYVITGEPRLLEFAEKCARTVSNRFTNKLWQDFGLAGFGEFLLDMHHFLGGEQYLNNATHLAEALLPHRIVRHEGVAFAGQDLVRISCDFGVGSAGIGIFIDRLLRPARGRFLFPDELLAQWAGQGENGAALVDAEATPVKGAGFKILEGAGSA